MNKLRHITATLILTVAVFFSFGATAQQAQTNLGAGGFELVDATNGIKVVGPGANTDWTGDLDQEGFDRISLSHDVCKIKLKEHYVRDTPPDKAHEEELAYIAKTMPGAMYLKKGEKVKVGGVDAVSLTYKNPATLDVKRIVFFSHRGVTYRLTFDFAEKDFATVKDDLAFIFSHIALFEPTAELDTVRSHPNAVAIKAPSKSWTLEGFGVNAGLVVISGDDYHRDAVVQLKGEDSGGKTLDEVYSAHRENLKYDYSGAEYVSEGERLKVAGVDAIGVTFKPFDNRIVNRDILFIHKGRSIRLRFGAVEENWDKHKADFSRILKELVVLE